MSRTATAQELDSSNLAQSASKPTLQITGTVSRVNWRDTSSGFYILSFMLDPPGDQLDPVVAAKIKSFVGSKISLKGNLPAEPRTNKKYSFTGSWGPTHPQWGPSFNFTSCEILLPSGAAGVAKYLASIKVHGIGSMTAKKIAEIYPDFINQIKASPEIVDTLVFLSDLQREAIKSHLAENAVHAELSGMLLNAPGIGAGTVMKIYNYFKLKNEDPVQALKQNPYRLADEIAGIGFVTADAIALSSGVKIDPRSPYRVKAAIKYALSEGLSDGHCYLTPAQIATELLGGKKPFGNKMVPVKGILAGSGVMFNPDISNALRELINEDIIICRDNNREGVNAIYSRELYLAECAVAEMISRLLKQTRPETAVKMTETSRLSLMINDISRKDGIEYAPEQIQAILLGLQKPVSIITGGPGTGKSTITNAIIQIYKRLFPVNELYLCAPTGKAAKRMSEVTGEPAKTIHRLLRYNPEFGGFVHGQGNPLPGPGLLIADELSMIDIILKRDLLSAIDNLQVILIGDVDQLPSVGPGSVLRDLINSGHVPATRLKFNFRQAGGSKIALYANQVNAGEMIPCFSDGDVQFINIDHVPHAGEDAAAKLLEYVTALNRQGASPMQYQVLAPMNKFSSGVEKLNEKIREIVNPPGQDKPELGRFRLHDKVMVIKNSYSLGVFNGDLGQVCEVVKGAGAGGGDPYVSVNFGDGIVNFGLDDLGLLVHAYATTIHKSQGAEFPLVIVPITFQHTIMLLRNLLYTAMTRAKKRLVLIADREAVKFAIDTDVAQNRNSLLAERIKKGMAGWRPEEKAVARLEMTEPEGRIESMSEAESMSLEQPTNVDDVAKTSVAKVDAVEAGADGQEGVGEAGESDDSGEESEQTK